MTSSGRIKVYVIDPAKYQKSSQIQEQSQPQLPLPPPFPKQRPTKKRKLSVKYIHGNDGNEEESPAAAVVKESVTRAGRISKPYVHVTDAEKSARIRPINIRRREAASMFKCKTCSKIYVGYTKLKNHFLKFPDHESNDSIFRTVITKKSVSTQVDGNVEEIEDQNQPVIIPELSIPFNAHEEPEEEPSSSSTASSIRTSALLPGSEFLTPNRTWTPFSSFRSNSTTPPPAVPVATVASPTSSPVLLTAAVAVTVPANGKSIDTSLQPSPVKTVWDCVDEKITSSGINHALLELIDVSEKLSKISRDKIIPIREEEEELGIHSSLPIIRVDSPYLSHLLDLPFGTYVYREDGGTRRPPLPPPSATELSLTSGEVDIDKFLATNSIQSSLPHLTNIDFADM